VAGLGLGLDSVIFNWPDELFIKSKKDKKNKKMLMRSNFPIFVINELHSKVVKL
jgi:hypothetical protein